MAIPSGSAVLAIFLPVVVAVLSHLIAKSPKGGSKLAKAICILASYITLFLVSSMIFAMQDGPVRVQLFTISLPTGIVNVGLYVDSLALVPAFLSSLFTALALTYNVYYLSPYNRAYNVGWEFNRSYSFILLFNGAMLGTLFSNSLLGLIIFWELVSVCSYVLISFWNEERFSLWAATKCFIMTHVGSLALLVATIIIYFITGTLEISELAQMIPLGAPAIPVIFPLLLIAALPKTVLFPLHTWLPDGTVAPTSATVVFHVCGFQTGIYMIIRFFSDVFHEHVISSVQMPLPLVFGNISVWSFVISLIGAITFIIGAVNGLVENDFKRIIAYGTISGLGCIIMAAGLTTPLSIVASLFLMISHALCFGLLFLCAGAVIYTTGKHNINEIGGLYQHMPITAFCCLIGIFTWSTVPLLSEFAGKYLLFHATINVQATLFTVIAFLGCVLNVAIAMRLMHSVFMKKSAESPFRLPVEDPPVAMLAPMVLMTIFLIVFGVAPTIPLSSLVIPAARDIGFPETVVVQWLIETPLGFWDPFVIVISIVGLFALFSSIILYLGKITVTYRKPPSEEAFKPFLCGEDISLLDCPKGNHFYHVLTKVMKVDVACEISNVDVAYNKLSKKFFDFCGKLLRLDIQQNYFVAFASFIAGTIVVLLIAFLGG